MKSYNNQHKNDDDNVKTSNKTGEIALRYSLNYYYYYHFFPSFFFYRYDSDRKQ